MNMESSFDEKFRAGIYVHLFDKLRVNGKLTLKHFEYESGKKYHTAYGMITEPSDPIYLIVATPNVSDDVYVMMTDGDPSKLSGELAGIQQYNEEREHICLDHTVPTENQYLVSNGWSSFLTLVPETAHDSLPSAKEVRGRSLKFRLVVPITESERELKIKNGITSLLDHFDKTERDTISFVQGSA
jgi:hypothetical protein